MQRAKLVSRRGSGCSVRLLKLNLNGYRRFQESTSIVLEDRLTAIIGRNESGKSSLLAALQTMGSDAPIPPGDRTRDSAAELELVARFYVEAADRDLVADVRGGPEIA